MKQRQTVLELRYQCMIVVLNTLFLPIGGLQSKKRAVEFYKKGINELELGLAISCEEDGRYNIVHVSSTSRNSLYLGFK